MWEIIWILTLCYLFLFFLSLRIKDNSIVDIFWWTGFVIVALMLFFQQNSISIHETIFIILFCIWWMRLTYHIWKRKFYIAWEDSRYAVWRKQWKYFKLRSFFQVYLLQAVLLMVISTALFVIFSIGVYGNMFTYIWIIFMVVWFLYEFISDLQLKKYVLSKQEKNKIFTKWLYKYSRHPNYLWESVFWLWVSIMWLQNSILSLISFIVITGLLLFVSWIPLKEERYKKKDNWEEYSKKTPKFLPNVFNKKV
jgi:steroid 5-alpha reductase family enzyme